MSTSLAVNNAENFIWNNARLLERHLFSFLFSGGQGQPVLAALRAYQNDDGGFGNALEPDKRCRDSQPVDQEIGLTVLDDIGFDCDQAVVQRVCDFLVGVTTPEGGVPFVLPSVRSAPRAAWWNTDDNPPASINPTASISGLLHKHVVQHPWLDPATEFCWKKIARIQTDEVHDLLAILTFLQYVPDRARAQQEFARIAPGIVAATTDDPHASGYVKKPLDWAPTPQSLCRSLYADELMSVHLDALAAQQQEDGGWPISWPPVSPMCELECRGAVTIGALKTLKAYGRL